VRADAVHLSPNARSSEPARILISPVEVVSRLIELVFAVGLPNRRRAIAACNFVTTIGIQLNDGDKPKYFLDLLCQKLGRSVSGLAFDEGMTLFAARRRHA